MIHDSLIPEIQKAAKAWALDPLLIAAIILQESAGNPYALRFEPGWSLYKDPEIWAKKNGTSVATEKMGQAFSYGLCQIMGTVARERGFQGPLGKLYAIDTNLLYACAQLRLLYDRHKNESDVISAYNAGTPKRTSSGYINQSYVNSVYKFKRALADKFKPV